MRNRRSVIILLAILTLLWTSLSCNFPWESLRGLDNKDDASIKTTEDLGTLATDINSTISTSQPGDPIVIEYTEEELTSTATTELQSSGENRIRNIQIRLRDGTMNISGDVNQGGLNLPLDLRVKFIIDAQGKPRSQVVSASVGIFPLPDNYLSDITNQLDQMMSDELNVYGNNLIVDSITIADGRMTIIAHKQ